MALKLNYILAPIVPKSGDIKGAWDAHLRRACRELAIGRERYFAEVYKAAQMMHNILRK